MMLMMFFFHTQVVEKASWIKKWSEDAQPSEKEKWVADHQDMWVALLKEGESSFNFNKSIVNKAIKELRIKRGDAWDINEKKAKTWDESMTSRFRSLAKYFGNAWKRRYKWALRLAKTNEEVDNAEDGDGNEEGAFDEDEESEEEDEEEEEEDEEAEEEEDDGEETAGSPGSATEAAKADHHNELLMKRPSNNQIGYQQKNYN